LSREWGAIREQAIRLPAFAVHSQLPTPTTVPAKLPGVREGGSQLRPSLEVSIRALACTRMLVVMLSGDEYSRCIRRPPSVTGRWTDDGVALWRLTVRGAELPGLFVVIDRQFWPAE
jgi:hypothetical protein